MNIDRDKAQIACSAYKRQRSVKANFDDVRADLVCIKYEYVRLTDLSYSRYPKYFCAIKVTT